MKTRVLTLIVLLSIFSLSVTAERENLTRIDIVDKVMTLETQPPTINVFGTEYTTGEDGKTFLQVVDNGVKVDNASCRLNVFFPNTTSLFINNTLMIQHEEGLQFVPFVVPEQEGVYMVTAQCQYFIQNQFIFEEDSLDIINLTVIQGTYLGSPIVLNSRRDGLVNEHDSTVGGGTKVAEANYQWVHEDLLNATDLSLQWLGSSDTTGVLLNLSYFDFNQSMFIQLGSIETLSGTSNFNILEYITRDIPETGISINGVNGTVFLKLRAEAAPGFVLIQDWFVLHSTILTNQSENDIRGGGELHVFNGILDETKDITEELNMLGLIIAFISLFIIALMISIFAQKWIHGVVSFVMFFVTFQGFKSLNLPFIALLTLMLMVIAIMRTMVLLRNVNNEGDESAYSPSLNKL